MMTLPGTTVQIDSTVLDYLRRLKDTGRRAWLDTPTPAGDCGNCGGSGRLLIQVSDDGPFDSPLNLRGATHVADVGWFSSHTETIPCPACSRWTQRFEQSGLLAQEYDWNIEYLRGRGGKGSAYRAAHGLLAQLPDVRGLLAFYGDYGMGKTGLLKAAVATACRFGIPARYVRASDIVAEATATFHDDDSAAQDRSEAEVRQRYAGYRLLAIDEIDRVGSGDWTRQFLHAIYDQRYAARETCATLLATNCHMDALPHHLGYLASRLDDGRKIEVGGEYLRGGDRDTTLE
ncbi:MAG: ATP-binding protein [Anaerolineales bacterium]|nr:ATP-binding protein [Anaerolineales bacterium]